MNAELMDDERQAGAAAPVVRRRWQRARRAAVVAALALGASLLVSPASAQGTEQARPAVVTAVAERQAEVSTAAGTAQSGAANALQASHGHHRSAKDHVTTAAKKPKKDKDKKKKKGFFKKLGIFLIIVLILVVIFIIALIALAIHFIRKALKRRRA
ncbi:hypothetical protein [Streptomyces roseoverticillatus]|uniref:hypothetical protein n=1 Tax=Streptomyces roseoverticillatus TaxID=66429 RepID=UPI0012FEA686|nr:hypothetical protein [Streptomyces roseoverticillatus]